MNLSEVFSKALKYPISDFEKLLIIGVIFVLSSLTGILAQFDVYNSTLNMIWVFVAIILNVLLIGYGLSVIKDGIELSDSVPGFEWGKNFVDGIKYLVVAIIYYIIPAIITFIIAMALGSGPIAALASDPGVTSLVAANSSATANQILSSASQSALAGLMTSMAVTSIIAIILFIIFGLFANIAICRLAKYDSIGEALSFGKVWADLKEIGILKVFAFMIILAILIFIIAIILGFVAAVPFIGAIIAALFGNSYMILFSNRALGLLYSEI